MKRRFRWLAVRIIFQVVKERPFLIATILLGLVPLAWFRPWGTLITGGDFWLPLGTVDTLKSLLSSWLPNVSGGQPNSIVFHAFPYFAFWSLFRFFGLALTHIEKLWFVSLYLTAGVSVYFLVDEIFGENRRSYKNFVAASFYLFNLYIMMTGVVTTTLLSYSLMPLILLLYIKGLKSQAVLSSAMILALVLTLNTSAAGNPPIFLIPFLLLFLYFIYHLFVSRLKDFAWKFNLSLVFFYLLFNLWWLFLFVKGLLLQISAVQAITAAATVGAFSNFYDLIRLLGSWAFFAGHQGAYYFPFALSYLNPVLMFLTFLIPALVFAGYFFHLRKYSSIITFFALLLLLGLFLSHGQAADFLGGLYSRLKSLIPFFWIYREPFAKFAALTTLAYTVLLASFFTFLESRLNNKRLLLFLTLLTVSSIMTVAWPEVSGDHFPEKRGVLAPLRTQVPDYWWQLATYLKGKENEGRVFVLPDNPDWNRSGIPYVWGYDSADVGPHLLTVPWVERNNGFYGLPVAADQVAKFAYQVFHDLYLRPRDLSRVWGLLGVTRLLQRNDVDLVRVGELSDFYSPQRVQSIIATQSGISREKSFGALDLYQLSEDKSVPKIYIPQKTICLSGQVKHLDYPLDLENQASRLLLVDKDLDDLCDQNYVIPVEVSRLNRQIKSETFSSSFESSGGSWLDFGDQAYNFYDGDKNFGFSVNRPGDYQLVFLPDERSSPEKSLPTYRLNFLSETQLKPLASGVAKPVASDETIDDLGTYHLDGGKYIIAVNHPNFTNLIENYSFEQGSWKSSLQDIPIPVSPEAVDGSESMSLGVNVTDAYQKLVNLDSNLIYSVSFFYKVKEEAPPVFFIWENKCDFDYPVWESYLPGADNSCKSKFITAAPIEVKEDWTKYQYEYRPGKEVKKRGMGFAFLDPLGKIYLNKGETLIDNVIVTSKFYGGVVARTANIGALPKNPEVNLLTQSATYYRLGITGAKGNFPLVLSESFDPGWQARVIVGNQKFRVPESRHFRANLFANGWILENEGDYQVEIFYTPELTFRVLLVVSAAGVIVVLIFLARQHFWPSLKVKFDRKA